MMPYLLFIIAMALLPLAACDKRGTAAFAQAEAGEQGSHTTAADPWAEVLNRHLQSTETHQVPSDPWVIRAPGEETAPSYDRYNIELLRLILDKTVPKYGPYRLILGEQMNRLRAFVEVRNHSIDVAWSVSTSLREKILRPVRREMIGGMNGYRVLMIRGGEQARFDQIKSPAQLQKLVAGGGYVSQPTEIWRANYLPVVTSDDYLPLFSMLVKKRFDYFPRAVFEAWMELAQHPDLGLTLEKNLLIHFEAPAYFFVHPDRRDLEERLTLGMDLAMEDGSLAELFTKVPYFRELQDDLCGTSRRVIELQNTLLPQIADRAERRFFRSPQQLAKCSSR